MRPKESGGGSDFVKSVCPGSRTLRISQHGRQAARAKAEGFHATDWTSLKIKPHASR